MIFLLDSKRPSERFQRRFVLHRLIFGITWPDLSSRPGQISASATLMATMCAPSASATINLGGFSLDERHCGDVVTDPPGADYDD
jgi:hypothetical protein